MKKQNKRGGNWLRQQGIIGLVVAVVATLGMLVFMTTPPMQTVRFSDFKRMLERQEIETLHIEGSKVQGVTKAHGAFTTTLPDGFQEQLQKYMNEQPALEVTYYTGTPGWSAWWIVLISILMVLPLAAWILYRRITGQKDGSGGIFGMTKSRSKVYMPSEIKTRFEDVAGAEEAKKALAGVADFLKNPEKYRKSGARVPRGILLIGEPGNGKTLLARALAGSARCPFILCNGSDFIEVFVGVGAARVRDMFAQARKLAPCIIFIDEIDAVGRHRGAGMGGGNDEREQTLNQLLTEMDGFDNSSAPIVVIAATNRPEVLDKALLRPGRFDERIVVPFPDRAAREQILHIAARAVTLAPDVDLGAVSGKTAGFSGADLAHLINQAAVLSAQDNAEAVTQAHIERALQGVLKSRAEEALETPDVRSQFMPHQVATRFTDVAGLAEAKQELAEVVDILVNPDKYGRLGARVPRGILLTGDPGNGKTLLARAVAGESDRPFFYASGSSFMEMYVGVGAQRVRELFAQARKHAPSIVFIDEIDAIGARRHQYGAGGEYVQTINQLLTEMDGFQEGLAPVVVLGATNRPDSLDEALMRPGRFDRQVHVPYPDIRTRREILKTHLKKVLYEEHLDLDRIAQSTSGMSGASLAALINEAALLAARKDKALIGYDEIDEARDKLLLGIENRSLKSHAAELKQTAYHEAGHALVGMLHPDQRDPLYKVTIVPRGGALGLAHAMPAIDTHSCTKEQYLANIARMLGGRAAEELIFKVFTSGASSDLQQATGVARSMVCAFGMSDRLGPVSWTSSQGESRWWSQATDQAIDEEVRRILQTQYTYTLDLLTRNQDKLEALTQALLAEETLSAARAYEVVGMPLPASLQEKIDQG